jgi:hypothetical protein
MHGIALFGCEHCVISSPSPDNRSTRTLGKVAPMTAVRAALRVMPLCRALSDQTDAAETADLGCIAGQGQAPSSSDSNAVREPLLRPER